MTLDPVRFAGRTAAAVASFLLFASASTPARAVQVVHGTTGEFTTAVVLVTFSDNTTQPKSAAETNTMVFGGVNDFLWENSYQQMFISGKTFGYFPIPISATTCDTMEIAAEADRAANAAGANLSQYNQIIYMFPDNTACGWSGTGGMNAAGQPLIFVNGDGGFRVNLIAHELGHRFHLKHSNALDCNATPIGDTCVSEAYGDPTDAMGNRLGHFNAVQKEMLGWLDAGASPQITTVTASGRYRIEPLETKTNGVKALKVRKGTDSRGLASYYYLEYRQPIGADTALGTLGTITKGVMVHTGSPGDLFSSLVLDMTPNTIFTSKVADFFDGALMPGKTFSDATAGASITVVSVDPQGATVDVVVTGTQPPPPPAPVTLTETVGTDKTTYARGETVAMSALVKRDGVPSAGATVKFTVTTPAGGSTVLSATTGNDGFARASYKSAKAKSAAGSYSLRADASQSANSATATTTFGVR